MATEKQIAFLNKLLDERINLYATAGEIDKVDALRSMDVTDLTDSLDVKEASASINRMLAGNKAIKEQLAPLVAARKGNAAPAAELTEGMYRNAEGRIFRVQENQEGTRLYAKELLTERDEDGNVTAEFVYTAGAMRLITAADRMSLEEAKEYGIAWGRCCVCSRTLKKKESIEAGIGPVCASRV